MASSDLDLIREWIGENDLCLLVFTTETCGVCNALKPRVGELAEREPALNVRYVDAERSAEAAGQYGVFAVPVYILFVQGRETVRFARHFGMNELESAVNRYARLLEG